MVFDTDYWHALDKQTAKALDVKPSDIGISHGVGDVLQGLNANIRKGASVIELGFTGKEKGSLGQGNTTPEMFGKDKREAIRQLQKINEVTVSTHASIGVSGLSGLEERGFSDRAAETSLNEVKRVIDFAADATYGGPVVVHAIEFPREIGEKYKEFETYPSGKKIPKEEVVSLVDKDTGQLIRFQKGMEIDEPKWKKNEKGQYIDYNGNPISEEDVPLRGVPVYDEKGNIEFEHRRWDDFEKEAKKIKNKTGKEIHPGELFYYKHQLAQLERARPYADQYRRGYEQHINMLKELKRDYKLAKQLEEAGNADAKQIKRKFIETYGGLGMTSSERYDIINSDQKASDFINEQIRKQELELQRTKEGFIGYQKEIEQIEKLRRERKIVPAEEFALDISAKNYARAAIYAYEKEQIMKKQNKLKRPLFIAPENVFPEGGYGAHPEELKELILESRKKMAEMLKEQNRSLNQKEAEKIAANHIKATFDIGHAYTWKKFFKPEKGETEEEREKRFQKWLMKEVDKLNKEGIIGHIHLSDNFGYYDEHLTPGEGSVPLKEFVKKMKEAGYKDIMIAEPGAQAEQDMHEVMTGAWAHLGTTPLYRTSRWTDIEDSYLGRTSAPYRIVGAYAPSDEYRGVEKGAPFWTGLGLE
jgi:sugar phosphate isomerase/epimerase